MKKQVKRVKFEGHGTLHHPILPEKRRAIVSVAFSAEEFQRVAQEAEARGMFVSAYIRQKALPAQPTLGTRLVQIDDSCTANASSPVSSIPIGSIRISV